MKKPKALKPVLHWISDPAMRAMFSNEKTGNPDQFQLVAVYHKSEKGGFDRELSDDECRQMLQAANPAWVYVAAKKKGARA